MRQLIKIEIVRKLGLEDSLTRAATLTAEPGDQLACAQAAGAARRIRDLMAGTGRDRDLR